ncbi:MAG: acyltransferase [Rhodanobacteraceae bacterium]
MSEPRALRRFFAGRTLAECLDSGRDNFLVLRLVAALMVVLGHSFLIVGGDAHVDEPLHRLLPRTYAHLAGVAMFFAISGYLITLSFQRKPELLRFARARVLRLWPALVVVVAAWAFVLGPMLSTLPPHEYFGAGDAHGSAYRYFWSNVSLFRLWPWLPGLFASNPIASYVNGSLWTIPWEATMYIAVAAAGVLRLLRFPWLASAVILALVVVLVLWPIYAHDAAATGALPLGYELAACFGAGSIACLLRRYLPISTGILLLLALVALVGRDTLLIWPAILYFVFWFAYVPRLPAMHREADLSYGTYLWAFPVQQAVVQLTAVESPFGLFAIATPIVLAIAAASWFLVERPALRLKQRSRHIETATAEAW